MTPIPLVYFFKGIGQVSERLLSPPPTQIAIPPVVVYELAVGIAKSTSPQKRLSRLQQLLSAVKIVDFGLREAQSAAEIRADLEGKGCPMGPHDTLIAGTAIARSATLITRNTKEFNRIENLQLEDWY